MTYGQLPPDSDIWHFPVMPVRVVDGDTIDVRADLGFQCTRKVRLRLYGVDTAEIYGSKEDSDEHSRGQEHKAFVGTWLNEFAQPGTDWPFRAYTLKVTGKYGRYIADIVDLDRNSLVAAILDEFGDEVLS